ncbi:MAG: hypothetical protein JXR60_11555 [Bacteroidales bacterium]|nr:hypothetical protein [Bacteroidales bacterium]
MKTNPELKTEKIARHLMSALNGDFGKVYHQFKGKPKEAIKHLLKVKHGECPKALYRSDIGYIDIVWGENDKNNKGFGLKHIVEKHGHEINQLGFNVEDFIPIVVQFGINKKTNYKERIYLYSEKFKAVISTKWNGKKKTLLLTTFELKPLNKKKV